MAEYYKPGWTAYIQHIYIHTMPQPPITMAVIEVTGRANNLCATAYANDGLPGVDITSWWHLFKDGGQTGQYTGIKHKRITAQQARRLMGRYEGVRARVVCTRGVRNAALLVGADVFLVADGTGDSPARTANRLRRWLKYLTIKGDPDGVGETH